MTDAELRALIAVATKGPLSINRVSSTTVNAADGHVFAACGNRSDNSRDALALHNELCANAALIVAAVNALPGLLDRLAAAEADAARLSVLLDDANDRCHDTNQKYNALCLALKTHAGDTDGYEFGLGRVKFKHGNPVSFLWAGQDEIDAAIDAARAAIKETK